MVEDRDTALQIINEYKTVIEDDDPLPEEDDQLIAKAQEIFEGAQKLWEQDPKDKKLRAAIQSIIWLGDSPIRVDGQERVDLPRKSSGGFSDGDLREGEQGTPGFKEYAIDEKLPIPAHIEGDAEPMPRDLSTVSDKQIRRLSGEFNAFLTRATYLLGVETADLINAQHLLEDARNTALRGLTVEKKLAKVIDAELAADEKVKEWADRVNEHEKKVTILKSLKEIYSGNVDRLSREWTMRQNEWEKSR